MNLFLFKNKLALYYNIPRTSYGLLGRDIKDISDNSCKFKILTNKHVRKYILNNTFKIPKFQRRIEEDKVNEIIDCFKENKKTNNNYFIHHGYTLSLCEIRGDFKEFWVIDGQHRLEAINKLADYDFSIIVRIKICKTMKDMQTDFKNININTKIPPIFTCFEEGFLQSTLLSIKIELETGYKKCFSRNNKKSNRSNKMHINSFIQLFEINKIKQLYDRDKIDYGNYEYLLDKLFKINKKIIKKFRNYEDKEKYHYYINKIDKNTIFQNQDDDSIFCLSLNNINWIDNLYNNENDIKINAINKYKKKHIPKKIKIEVLNRDFGKESNVGKCYVCKDKIYREDVHIGHIIPEHSGGKTITKNLKAICAKCNLSMGTRNMNEYIDE